jgi:phytoene/squalene synthetase
MSEKLPIDESKLTFLGSMNYIVQVHRSPDGEIVADQYQPRRNKIWTGEFDGEEIKTNIAETIERMKIAINQFNEFLEGTRDSVYYWELEDEKSTLN